MLDRLNNYLRATLRASRSDEFPQRPHTLQDEFDRLRDYLELMAVRMGPRLRYTLARPPNSANTHCRRCCCNRWWKTRSATASNPMWTAACSP
ncbi:MAG: histidine kinase [Burkholderiaceae bacterium]